MTICRKIWVNSLEEIDFQNVGNHWTVEGNEAAVGMMTSTQLNGEDQDGEFFWLYVDGEYEIDEAATEESNLNHPAEKEVILKRGQDIVITEVFDSSFRVVATNVPANTGDRVAEWVRNLG